MSTAIIEYLRVLCQRAEVAVYNADTLRCRENDTDAFFALKKLAQAIRSDIDVHGLPLNPRTRAVLEGFL